MKKKHKPNFQRQNSHRKKRVKYKGWRSPRGIDSRQRRRERFQPSMPRIGYGTGKIEKEILVHNVNEIIKLPENLKVKISSTVGKKKKIDILKKAKEKKIEILNA